MEGTRYISAVFALAFAIAPAVVYGHDWHHPQRDNASVLDPDHPGPVSVVVKTQSDRLSLSLRMNTVALADLDAPFADRLARAANFVKRAFRLSAAGRPLAVVVRFPDVERYGRFDAVGHDAVEVITARPPREDLRIDISRGLTRLHAALEIDGRLTFQSIEPGRPLVVAAAATGEASVVAQSTTRWPWAMLALTGLTLIAFVARRGQPRALRQSRAVTSFVVATALLSSACGASTSEANPHEGAETVDGSFTVEIWADNWFAVAVGETLLLEDPVPITTERSFNAETVTFDATYPFTLNIVARDYIQDDSGLEYIGASNQQIGDGGLIAQVRDGAGQAIATTHAGWRCLVIHRAPLNPTCVSAADPITECQSEIDVAPEGWMAADYDDSAWPPATEFTEAEVSPKDGYTEIAWDESARLIWSDDLELDNTLLCRFTVTAP